MFNVTCLIKTDIDTVKKCMGQNPYNPETFLQNFTSRLTSFDDPLLNIYPTSEIAGNIEAHGDIDGDYWCTTTDKDLNRTIRECRTEILVNALLARGSEAVEEFLGYPVNMSEAECVLEEYLNNLSDEDLANAFFETL